MCRIGVWFRSAWKASKDDILNKTIIAWNGNNLNHEHLQDLINKPNSGGERKKGKDGRLPKTVSDDKAASEMKRLASALSRGFQPM